ncbi:MAG: agmatine deiminase family protein [Polyangiaceae bacterium]|nr:agmatine deiminase family protein [Polyangiaceae bacterium]
MPILSSRRAVLLGVLIGVVIAAGLLMLYGRLGPARDPVRLPGTVLPEADGRIAEVAMHWTPEMDALMAETYADFLRALPTDVRVTMIVASGMPEPARTALARRLDAIDPSGALEQRVHLVESAGPITTWSKDRALVATPRAPREPAWLIAPLEPRRNWAKRHNDWKTVQAIADASDGKYRAHVAPFAFDAGDFAVQSGRLIVDSNLIEKNRRLGATTPAALKDQLAAWFHAPVIVLGERPGDTPKHHLAMYMTPLQERLMLVGDPAAAQALVGADFAPGEVSVETETPLRADFSPRTRARFERVAADLAALGYRVERIPNVPFDDKTYLSYTNAVFDVRDGKRFVFMPVYDLPTLDEAAKATYEKLGWEVRPVRVRKVYPHHGTIGCLVNVLARD